MPFEMGAVAGKNGGSYAPLQEVESSKVLTQRLAILILMVMLLLPFVFARLFISHITILPTAHYTELPSSLPSSSSTSSNVSTAPYDYESQQEQGQQRQEEAELPSSLPSYSSTSSNVSTTPYDRENQQEQDQQRQEESAEGEGDLKQLEDNNRQERSDAVNLTTHHQQEHVESDDPIQLIDFSVGGCNIWKGKWIPHHSKPAYTNETCEFIQGHQNCLKNGRPDHQYLQWRWKPHDCELPLFNAKKFLKLVHGKAWAFVGDSISRNHFQSFLCFLAQVERPQNVYRDERDLFVRWFFPSYNFTLAVFWSPFLVEWTEDDVVEGFPTGTEKLHLDNVDEKWASSILDYDYVVLSAGHWFLKSSIYFMNNEVIGCHYCPGTNCTQLGFYYGYRTALRTVYDFLVSSSYRGIVFFRTFTPDHFENGQWHEGGNCMHTTPTHNATLSGVTEEMYKIQLEEYGRTLQMHCDKGCRFKIVDTIHASLVRADGHPGPYRSVGSSANDLPQDCLHWCLPGAIDTWSAMLLEMLRHS